jgi:uncharacterized protein YndB with AHSA1/START domain
MEGFLAIGGFWLVILVAMLKKPLMQYIVKSKAQESKDVIELKARVLQLEGALATMSKDVLEMKDTSEFAHKLLSDSAQQVANISRLLADKGGADSGSHNLIAFSPAKEDSSVKLLTDNDVPLADLGKVVNEHTVRFERVLPVSADRVWQYLTTPECLSRWLATATLEPRIGGRVTLDFDVTEMPQRLEGGANIRGLVSWIEPQRGLAYSWIDTKTNMESVVSFELTPQGEQSTSLVVTHSRLPKDKMHEYMAGWHTHLDVLKARLSNVAPPNFRRRFGQVVKTYAAIVATVVASGGSALAAQGTGVNPNVYQAVQTERSQLMSKYDLLSRDADNIQRRINLLKQDNSNESDHVIDQLDRQLQGEYRDIHKIELEIKDIDRATY